MVPPGSRQVLSTGPADPSSGYGENTLGTIAESDPVRLPDLATVFERRAERLRVLAEGHELEGFLRVIAALAAAQHAALGGRPPGALPAPGQCRACGSPPIAGLISPGGTKYGHRHLHCSLCATAWRYVRVRCVHCGSTDKISFRNLAGTSYLRAECCESCHGYSKVFYIDKVRSLEPLADDLASLGLDVLVGEEGFAPTPNPFVLGTLEQQ